MAEHFLCAYGNTSRWSEKVASAEAAALATFGLVRDVTCIPAGGRRPCNIARTKREALKRILRVLHKQRTGNDLSL